MKVSEQSVQLIDHMGSDLSVVNAARVSFHKESAWEEVCIYDGNIKGFNEEELKYYEKQLKEQDIKLINYLAKHKHWTPFAHAFASFRIKAPIFVARQLVKHQVGLAWNEVSRRYVNDEPEFWFPKELRGKPVSAKQGSTGVIENDHLHIDGMIDTVEQCLCDYLGLIEAGVAPEQARMVLPQNTMTEWIWSGSLAAFARVCKLRLDSHAQAETSEVAEMIDNQMASLFPVSFNALMEN